MAALPPPSFNPQALLPMPGARPMARGADKANASRLIGNERALLSDAPKTGMSMLSLRSTGTKKRRRR